MKKITKNQIIMIVLVSLCLVSFITMLIVLKSRIESVEVVEVPASTEDRFTGERDGKWYIDGQEVDKKHYNAYLEMMNDSKTTEKTTEQVALNDKTTEEKTDNKQVSEKKTTVSQTTTKTTTTQSSKPATNTTTSNKTQTANTSGTSNTGSTNTTSNPTSSNTNTSGTSSSSQSSSQTTTCNHNWKEITKTIHHDAVYQTIVTPAVYANYYCRDCGTYCYSLTRHCEATGCSESNWTNVAYGSYVLTPEKREQKLVKDAYDEQIGTGVYECTKCHAKK